MFAGASWLDDVRKIHRLEPLSPFGRVAADILGQAFLGIYHISEEVLHKSAIWGNNHVEVPIWSELSTYDSDVLTRLVLLAHDSCVRVSVEDNGRKRGMRLTLHERLGREGRLGERHPTLEEHTASLRTAMITDVRGASPATATCQAATTEYSAPHAKWSTP